MITSSHTFLPFSIFSIYRNGSNTEDNIRCVGEKSRFLWGICSVLRYIFDTARVQNRPPQFVPHLQENYFKLKRLGLHRWFNPYTYINKHILFGNFPIDTEKNDNDGEK